MDPCKMNPYEMAEKLFSPKCSNLSASEQLESNYEMLNKAGYLTDKLKTKYDKIIKEQQDVEKSAASELMAKMMLKDFIRADEADEYGDGDQTPLKGNEAQKLRTQWSNGMDFHPQRLTVFHQACYVGDSENVRITLSRCSDKRKLLEKRESLMRFSALFMVLQGAKAITQYANGKINHLDTMKLLIEAGANVNARDVAGYSVLFHCFTAYGNEKERLVLSEELMKAGADINLPNRFGCTSLHENVLVRNFSLLEFLVEHGGDPSIKDNDGIAPNSLVALFPEAQKIFSKAGFISGNKTREKIKSTGDFGKCSNCGKCGAKKRCSKCLIAYYCGKECQKENWKAHRKECIKKEKGKVKVDVKGSSESSYCASINWKNMNVYASDMETFPSKPYFKVKIQVPIDNVLNSEKSALLVYNKERTFQRCIQPTNAHYDNIVKKIRKHGVLKVKAYFYASTDEDGELSIQLDNVLPPESW